MLEEPALDQAELAAALRTAYGIQALEFRFVRSYDLRAASYDVAATDGRRFVKVHFSPLADASLRVPRALLDAGVSDVLAPMRTLTSALSHPIGDGRSIVVYPFVVGQNAMVAGMTGSQWRAFGRTLRGVHDSGLAERFGDRLPAETFALPAAAAVRAALAMAERPAVDSTSGQRLKAFLAVQAGRVCAMLQRAEELRARLAGRPLTHVLCHADIHAANVVVADDGRILLVDWDGPMRAPRERDLLFVIGARIARNVEPYEEAWFFEGYGDVEVDREAIIYYRYERIFEDIAEAGMSVFGDPALGEASRESQVRLLESFFGPGGIVETVEG